MVLHKVSAPQVSFIHKILRTRATLVSVWLCCVLTIPAVAITSGVKVVHSSAKSLSIHFEPRLESFDTVVVGATQYLQPKFKGLSVTTTSSMDEISYPCLRELITVPAQESFRLSSCTIRYREISRVVGDLAPAKQLSSAPLQTLHLDSRTGAKSVAQWLKLEYLGLSATNHLARIIAPVLQRNADGRTLLVCESMDFVVAFDSQAQVGVNSSARQADLQVNVLNNNVVSEFRLDPFSAKSLNSVQNNPKGPKVQSSDLSDGTWVKVAVDAESVYRIDAAALASMGISIPATKIASVKLFGNGGLELPEQPSQSALNTLREQPIQVKTNSDGSLQEIVFYGASCRGFRYDTRLKRIAHYINHYSEKNYYFLTWGGNPGLRMSPVSAPSGTVQNVATQITSRILVENELVNAYTAGSGKRWFGEQVDAVVPRTFSNKLPGLLRNGQIDYVFSVAHHTASEAEVKIRENGQVISTMSLAMVDDDSYQDYQSAIASAKIAASNVASDGSSVLQFEYATRDNNAATNGLLDFFEIHYPAQLSAQSDKVSFVSDMGLNGVTQYSFNAFSSNNILGFDVTNPAAPLQLTNSSNTGGIYTFVTNIDSTGPRRFFVSASVSAPQLSKLAWAGLRDTSYNTDMIVICAAELNNSAQEYASYRRLHSKLSVSVVNVEDIYNEYGSGICDPTSIRDFISDAYRRWTNKPRYVLLWGDGHYDFKMTTTQRKNYVAMWENDDPIGMLNTRKSGAYTDSYSTDDFFACIVGNDQIVDLALGRLPIDSPETAKWMVEKIKLYEQKSAQDLWRTTATFVADDGPTVNGRTDWGTHVFQSEELTNDPSLVPLDVMTRKIYLSEYPAENIPKGRLKPSVTADMISMINNTGTLLLNWIGHGNPKVWAHESVLTRDITIPQFVNIDKLFFLASESCDFGRCDLIDAQSGAEMMLLSRTGGAIGTFAAARVSFSSSNAAIGQELFHQVFTRDSKGNYRAIGDISMSTKMLHAGDNDRKYYLLGDPAMHLLLPELVVRFDSLNGLSADSVSTASALSTVHVKGSIHVFHDNAMVDDFNGVVTLSLFDSDILRRFQDPSGLSIGDSTVFQVMKLGGALHRGNYMVKNGRFEAEFVVPKDISFSNKNGKLFAYAVADDDREAKGITRSLVIGGILNSVIDDVDGPELKIFIDGRMFQAGDFVRKSPLLIVDMIDETGINSTGIGIGHKIEAWLDDNSESIDLSGSYTSSLTKSNMGSAIKQLFNLSPGYHQVRARVWDVLNNVSTASTYFYVAADDSSVTANRLGIFPNPFDSEVSILFTHNQSYSFPVEAQIFTSAGHLVRSMRQDINSLQSGVFVWDAKDSSGNSVGQGSYTVVLSFYAPNGSMETKAATIVYLRN